MRGLKGKEVCGTKYNQGTAKVAAAQAARSLDRLPVMAWKPVLIAETDREEPQVEQVMK